MSALRGLAVTLAGRNLFAKLAAISQPLKISRVMFGIGKMPEGSTSEDLLTRTDLVSPFAEGSCTTPIYENDAVSMILEFRNDMHGGLSKTIWINEYGVFAQDPGGGEVLILYGNLGDCPDSVLAYRKGVVTTRDYPISVVIGSVSDVKLSFSASAFLTSQEADDLLEACLRRTVKLETVNVRVLVSDWFLDDENAYFPFSARVAIDGISIEHYPDMTLDNSCIAHAFSVGLSPTLEAVNNALIFHAQERPTEPFTGVCRLLRKGMERQEGGNSSPGSGSGGSYCEHYVIAVRNRDPSKPDYGIGSNPPGKAVLAAGPYTGKTEIGVVLNGVVYDAENMSCNVDTAPNGTLIIKNFNSTEE